MGGLSCGATGRTWVGHHEAFFIQLPDGRINGDALNALGTDMFSLMMGERPGDGPNPLDLQVGNSRRSPSDMKVACGRSTENFIIYTCKSIRCLSSAAACSLPASSSTSPCLVFLLRQESPVSACGSHSPSLLAYDESCRSVPLRDQRHSAKPARTALLVPVSGRAFALCPSLQLISLSAQPAAAVPFLDDICYII